MSQTNLCALIPCAGRGERSGLSYPKTLYLINKKPILIHILELISIFTKDVYIIINFNDKKKFLDVLNQYKFKVKLVFQNEPKGKGDAILSAKNYIKKFENVLLLWGDIPYIKILTLKKLLSKYYEHNFDFLFVSKIVSNPYTSVKRDINKKVISITELKDSNIKLKKGEKDIGLFVFKKKIVFKLLNKNLENKFGNKSIEHGFLYIVAHLVKMKFKVDALEIAEDIETKSLNYMKDLK